MVTTLEYNRSIVHKRYSTKKRLFNYLKEQGAIKRKSVYKNYKGTKKDLYVILDTFKNEFN